MTAKNGTNGVHAKANGANGVHAPARSAAEPLTAIDLASAAVDAQKALLEDDRALLAQTEAARLAAEEADAEEERIEAAARQALNAAPQDGAHIDAAAHARSRRVQTRSILARAVKEHGAAKARVAEREQAIAKAKDALEVAQILAVLTDGSSASYLYELLEHTVACISQIPDAIRRVRERVAADGSLVARVRELGGPVLPMPDTTHAAGVLARAIHEHGGALQVGGNEHALRWVLETPRQHWTWDREGEDGARALVELVLRMLAAGRAGASRDRLALIGKVWSQHLDRDSAEKAIAELEAPKVAAREADNRAAHEKRLADKAQREWVARGTTRLDGERAGVCATCGKTVAQGAIAFLDEEGEHRLRHPGCPPAPPSALAEGEWSIGDDFSSDIPKVG